MFLFFAGLSLGTCLGVVVAALCFAAAGRSQARARRDAAGPVPHAVMARDTQPSQH